MIYLFWFFFIESCTFYLINVYRSIYTHNTKRQTIKIQFDGWINDAIPTCAFTCFMTVYDAIKKGTKMNCLSARVLPLHFFRNFLRNVKAKGFLHSPCPLFFPLLHVFVHKKTCDFNLERRFLPFCILWLIWRVLKKTLEQNGTVELMFCSQEKINVFRECKNPFATHCVFRSAWSVSQYA